jgi:MFS family permease
MEIRQVYRILTFAYITLLPNLLVFWILTILPEIVVHNLHVTDKSQISKVISYFDSVFFLGLIFGSFVWPYALRYTSKRASLLISLILQGVFNALTGKAKTIEMLIFLRFLTAMCSNMNTVGKDFIFDFAKPNYRQYAFSVKNVFSVAAAFLGPLLGYYVYQYSGKSLEKSLLYISMFYLIGIFFFLLVFFLDFQNNEIMPASVVLDEERVPINMDESNPDESSSEAQVDNKKKQKGIWEVSLNILKDAQLRGIVIVYFITNGIYKTQVMISILFLETSWSDGGMGIDSQMVVYINVLTYIPVALTILVAPIFVPKRISYAVFMYILVSLLLVALFALPFSRDMIKGDSQTEFIWIVYLLQSIINCATPKMYSPFLNFLLNNKVDKFSRTALNSITFILSNISAAVMVILILPFYSISMFDDFFLQFKPFNKYFCFIIMDLILILSFPFIKHVVSKNK